MPPYLRAAISCGDSGRDFLRSFCRRFWNHICRALAMKNSFCCCVWVTTNLDLLLIQRNACHELKTRRLVGLGVGIVSCLEHCLVLCTTNSYVSEHVPLGEPNGLYRGGFRFHGKKHTRFFSSFLSDGVRRPDPGFQTLAMKAGKTAAKARESRPYRSSGSAVQEPRCCEGRERMARGKRRRVRPWRSGIEDQQLKHTCIVYASWSRGSESF